MHNENIQIHNRNKYLAFSYNDIEQIKMGIRGHTYKILVN